MKPKRTSPRKKTASVRSQPSAGETPSSAKADAPRSRKRREESSASETPEPARKRALKVPPILLEGDRPTRAPLSGPGQRYALGPTPPEEHLETEGELPEAYGTQQLLLAARDPHWLYAHWDFTHEQQRRYNALSRDKHLVLRIFIDAPMGSPTTEVH